MPLSRSEAEDALRDITTTERASATTYGYRMASPHLIVWGIIWVIGYGASYIKPEWTVLWPALVMIGVIASFWFGAKTGGRSKGFDGRYGATALAVFLFIVAIFAIMPPRTTAQISAFFPILVALFYGLVGIWTRGARMLMAGAAVAALTVGGFFWLPEYFLLWMAAVGGGALILGGFWLRSV